LFALACAERLQAGKSRSTDKNTSIAQLDRISSIVYVDRGAGRFKINTGFIPKPPRFFAIGD
jgi:hypothetical protein